jgi:hypothetical protein
MPYGNRLGPMRNLIGKSQPILVRASAVIRRFFLGYWSTFAKTQMLPVKTILVDLDNNKTLVFLCLALSLFLIVPDQSLELYRYTAQSVGNTEVDAFARLMDAASLLISIILLSVVFLFLSAVSQSQHPERQGGMTDVKSTRFTLALIGCAPCLALSIGLYRATIDANSADLRSAMLLGAKLSLALDAQSTAVDLDLAKFDVDSQLQLNYWLFLGAGALFVLSALFFVCAYRLTVTFMPPQRFSVPVIVCGLGLPLLLTTAFVASPVSLARHVTSFGIVCLFFAAIGVFLVAARVLRSRVQLPVVGVLVVCALAFGSFNDNHQVRELSPNISTPLSVVSVGEGFKQWLSARKDVTRYEQYPVYIVAAEGGGIYAGFRTATFLASMQDLCPRFSHHLFAISSVSGGSVGAAIYSGLTQKVLQSDSRFLAGAGCVGDKTQVAFTDVAEEILRDDFLSPVLAAFLFPDFAQRFFFRPIPILDRAIALEKSLEKSWDDQTRDFRSKFPTRWVDADNPLQESFLGSWSPHSDVPALFINTTEVACGRGRVFSPFAINATDFTSFPLRGMQKPVDISLSTAAVLSARFPWLTPPGWLYVSDERALQCKGIDTSMPKAIHLVDGGYLDNSGVVTALSIVSDIIKAAKDMVPPRKVRINLIALTSGGFVNPSVILPDYLAPFQTLLRTREARGAIAVEHAELELTDKTVTAMSDVPVTFSKIQLQGYGYPLPLGWRLSPITRLLILGQNGDLGQCSGDRKGAGGAAREANCLRARMFGELSQ